MIDAKDTPAPESVTDVAKKEPSKPSKNLKTSTVKDVISKGRTVTGNKPDDIILNPVLEAKERRAVFAFGRFNPPTAGHEKLIHKVEDTAKSHGAEAHIIASHSEGSGKNPLPKEKKVDYLKKVASKDTHVSASSSKHPTLLHQLSNLHKNGVQHLTMVAGSDRVKEYHDLIHKYNGQESKHGHYNFKSINVVSAGHRDPDAEGAEGMSGTKMREHARSGNMKAFKSGLPKALHPYAEEIANHIKSVKENIDDIFDSFIIETAVEEIGAIYDNILNETYDEKKEKTKIKKLDHKDTHFRDDGTSTRTILYKHDTPGEPKSGIVKDDINYAFEAWIDDENPNSKEKEVINRHNQNRKKIQLVPRDNKDRKQDDRPYRQQSIVKKIIDEQPDVTFGKGPPDSMSSPSNDLAKQTLKLPKVGSLPWDISSVKKKPSGMPDTMANTPDMFKTEAYGKGYKSPWQKIMAVTPKGTEERINKSVEGLKQNAKDYQAIIDKETKKKTNESVNSSGGGGVRGMGYVSGNPDGDGDNYTGQNIANADTRDNIIKAQVKAHVDIHNATNNDKDTKKITREETLYEVGDTNRGREVIKTVKMRAIARAGAAAGDSVTSHFNYKPKEVKKYNKVSLLASKRIKEDTSLDPLAHLEDRLNRASDTSHDGIDKIMRDVASDHNMDIQDLHNKWVSRYKITPDQYCKEDREVWDKPNPKKHHSHMSTSQVLKAKARAKAAGRPYPNLVDNMAAMKENIDDMFTKFACPIDEESDIEGLVEDVFTSFGNELYEDWNEIEEEAEHDGRHVKLGKPFLTPGGPKKRAVYVKNDKGNVVKVNFGDPHLSIKRDQPSRRKSYRARHHCETPGPRWKANYWSCKYWSSTPTTTLDKG